MNWDQLIRNWHAKASEEDFFSKFVFEYLAFIAYMKRIKFSQANADRSAIQELKRSTEFRDAYLNLIHANNELRIAWDTIRQELNAARLGNVSGNSTQAEEIKWWNCSHDDLMQKTDAEKAKIAGVIHGLDDWENMIEYWYAIRNNLFHGAKNPQDGRDILLVENGYKTLRPLVELFLQ